MNARLSNPAVTSAMATPRKARGGCVRSMRSRNPVKITSASENPSAAANAKTTDFMNGASSFTLSTATPSTAQLVVMSGRKIPSAACNGGMKRFITMSTSCTNAAMTRMKAMVCKYSSPLGARMNAFNGHVTAAAMVMTKTTAPDMPSAVGSRFDTPRNGQMPRNRLSTKLLTRMAPSTNRMYSFITR